MSLSNGVDVLLADDRTIDADTTLHALRHVARDARVLRLKSGNEALQYLFAVGDFAGRSHGLPRVVLLDAEMPGVSGVCALEVMRAHPHTSAIPAMILSDRPLPASVRRNTRFRADAYIVRPLDFALYVAQLERHMRRWIPCSRKASSRVPNEAHVASATLFARSWATR